MKVEDKITFNISPMEHLSRFKGIGPHRQVDLLLRLAGLKNHLF